MEMNKGTIVISVAVLLGLVGAFIFGRHTAPKPEPVVIEKTDTLTLWDTITIDKPIYVKERVVDSIYVPMADTVLVSRNDTTFIVLPRTQKEYSDTLYHAWVSGYQPSLDSISVFQRTEYITTTITAKPKHWHITVGPQAGIGLTPKGWQPYLGGGVTLGYSF